MFNNCNEAMFGAPLNVNNSPASLASVSRGAAQVEGGTGAHAATAEPADQNLSPENGFPAPPAEPRDPWLPGVQSYDGRFHTRSGQMSPLTSPVGPVMNEPATPSQQNV